MGGSARVGHMRRTCAEPRRAVGCTHPHPKVLRSTANPPPAPQLPLAAAPSPAAAPVAERRARGVARSVDGFGRVRHEARDGQMTARLLLALKERQAEVAALPQPRRPPDSWEGLLQGARPRPRRDRRIPRGAAALQLKDHLRTFPGAAGISGVPADLYYARDPADPLHDTRIAEDVATTGADSTFSYTTGLNPWGPVEWRATYGGKSRRGTSRAGGMGG